MRGREGVQVRTVREAALAVSVADARVAAYFASWRALPPLRRLFYAPGVLGQRFVLGRQRRALMRALGEALVIEAKRDALQVEQPVNGLYL